jgi:uncharacterized protein
MATWMGVISCAAGNRLVYMIAVNMGVMDSKRNPVGWFEMPVLDMDRAAKFYEKVFGVRLARHMMGPLDMAWFPFNEDGPGTSGSLVLNKDYYKPSKDGVLVYFTTPSGDLEKDLKNVESAGGKILRKKTKISDEYGYMGLVLDTEGNRIALHSRRG